MANTSSIRNHMKSVSSISKITGAMQMVASARMHQAQQRADASRPYAEKLRSLLQEAVSDPSVMARLDMEENPLLVQRPVYKTAYIVMGSDKGLAGTYNNNIVKFTGVELRGKEDSPLIAIGKQMNGDALRTVSGSIVIVIPGLLTLKGDHLIFRVNHCRLL